MARVRDLVAEMVDAIVDDLEPKPGAELLALVNGLGATPLMELYVAYNDLVAELDRRGPPDPAQPGWELRDQSRHDRHVDPRCSTSMMSWWNSGGLARLHRRTPVGGLRSRAASGQRGLSLRADRQLYLIASGCSGDATAPVICNGCAISWKS